MPSFQDIHTEYCCDANNGLSRQIKLKNKDFYYIDDNRV